MPLSIASEKGATLQYGCIYHLYVYIYITDFGVVIPQSVGWQKPTGMGLLYFVRDDRRRTLFTRLDGAVLCQNLCFGGVRCKIACGNVGWLRKTNARLKILEAVAPENLGRVLRRPICPTRETSVAL